MKKQLEDELLEKVNGGNYTEQIQFVLENLDTCNLLGVDLKDSILTICTKLSSNELVNFFNIIEAIVSKKTLTEEKKLELQNELRRIVSTIKTN